MSAPAMPAEILAQAETATVFIADMVVWLNAALRKSGALPFEADTPLFATGLIDSIAILKLIAWTERAIGRRIPDHQIRMDNFHSVRRIAKVFVQEGNHVDS